MNTKAKIPESLIVYQVLEAETLDRREGRRVTAQELIGC